MVFKPCVLISSLLVVGIALQLVSVSHSKSLLDTFDRNKKLNDIKTRLLAPGSNDQQKVKNSAKYYDPPVSDKLVMNDTFCSIVGDPHVKSFLKLGYDFNQVGLYILYVTESLMVFGEFGRCSPDVTCVLGVSIVVGYKDSGTEVKPIIDLKKVDQKNGRLEPSNWCNFVYTDPKKIINNVFSENEWYRTFQNGRNGDMRENIDCYLKRTDIKQTFYFKIDFDQTKNKMKTSQTLIAIEYYTNSLWLNSVTIYPSVHASNYSLVYNSVNQNGESDFSNPTGMSGGVCGLTRPFDQFSSGFWHRENNKTVSDCSRLDLSDPNSADIRPQLTQCLSGSFTNYWNAYEFFKINHYEHFVYP